MSGSMDAATGVFLGSVGAQEEEAREGSARLEARWTLSKALRRFSQLTFAYGVSAVFATVSAVLMAGYGTYGGCDMILGGGGCGDALRVLIAIVPFMVSVVISGSVLTDLLEVLWEGVAGRLGSLGGLGGRLWGATLILLLAGVVSFGIGLVLIVVGLGVRGDYGALTPIGVAFLGVCGLAILAAVVLPSLALGPRVGQWVALVAAVLGSFATTEESLIAFNPPLGSSPLLGWMEGTFPLLNWNAGFGALIALSAFLIWGSYRYVVPTEKRGLVPVA